MRWIRRRPGLMTMAWVAVALGLLPMPADYYMLVRIFFCGLSLYFLARPAGVRNLEKWVLAGLVVFYNPLVPVAFGGQALWAVASVATVAYFHVLSRRLNMAPW